MGGGLEDDGLTRAANRNPAEKAEKYRFPALGIGRRQIARIGESKSRIQFSRNQKRLIGRARTHRQKSELILLWRSRPNLHFIHGPSHALPIAAQRGFL